MSVVVAPPALAATGSPSSTLNLSDNPVLASNATGWSVVEGGSALSRVSVTDHVAATKAARTVSNATTTRMQLPSEPVTPAGQPWSYAADVKASASTAMASVTVEWYAQSGAFLSYTEGSFVAVNPTNWTRTVVVATPPASAATARTKVNVINTASTQTVQITQHDVRAPAATRDPLKQPFASTSIWNMPIGSNAVYVNANLAAITTAYGPEGEWTPIQEVDPERIVVKPTAPATPIYLNQVGWGPGDRCAVQGGVLTTVPLPAGYVVPASGMNNGAAFLLADGRTIVQTQPFTRCAGGGPATSLTTLPNVDLYGPGVSGAHGGSGLSSIGGSLRLGELRPSSPTGPRHALKVNVKTDRELFECLNAADCFRWPASTADGDAVGSYGTDGHNGNTAMKMGALLAIPASVSLSSLGFETAPAMKLAWTLQNYGAYIVDHGEFSFSAEDGADGSFRGQFQADYGFDIDGRVRDNTPWLRDVNRLRTALRVVNNNSSAAVGGGGTPLQALAPEIGP